MRILVEIPNGVGSPIEDAIFEYVHSIYTETTYRRLSGSSYECMMGSKFPNEIIAAAKSWNKEIQEAFTKAYLSVIDESDFHVSGHWKPNTGCTHQLFQTTSELDGRFEAFGEHGVIITDIWVKPNFKHLGRIKSYLLDNELKAICEDPSKFAILTVQPIGYSFAD